jgi:tRNA pseudouridine55 synthase
MRIWNSGSVHRKMAQRENDDKPEGLLVLDKPGGMTSRAAVDRVLGWFPRGTRIGHTGTLDPLATGVLVLCLGSATRLVEYVQRMKKTYRSTIRLGARSTTDDADGELVEESGAVPADCDTIRRSLSGFVGRFEQVPPAFSAAKLAGQRAYALSRAGKDVDLSARTVEIHRIDLLAYDYPFLEIEVHCGKGTYIRSLARDLGERLGCGALVQTLRRTAVGPFGVADAVTLDADKSRVWSRLLPSEAALAELPRIAIADEAATRLRCGQAVAIEQEDVIAGEIAVFDATGTLVGVAIIDAERRLLRPEKILSRAKVRDGNDSL